MISTQDLVTTAKFLVARDGADHALAFAANGLEAMTAANQQALIPDWRALYDLIAEAAMGRLQASPTLH